MLTCLCSKVAGAGYGFGVSSRVDSSNSAVLPATAARIVTFVINKLVATVVLVVAAAVVAVATLGVLVMPMLVVIDFLLDHLLP